MMFTITNVLNAQQVDEVRRQLDTTLFVPGTRSAGDSARSVKDNEEVAANDPILRGLNQLVIGTLYQHPEFQSRVLPYRMSGAFFARYRDGAHYGRHTDNPIMGDPANRYRSDVAITIFLSDPSDYDGGELQVELEEGGRSVKLPAGDVVVYPASSLHEVRRVTCGERLVAIAWAQSLIRAPEHRALLHRLDRARVAGGTTNADIAADLNLVYDNLVRLWADV